MVRLFEGAQKNIKYVIKAVLLGMLFWLLQFAFQYIALAPNTIETSLIRSFAFTGATLIGISFLIGPLFTLFPRYNFIFHRRTFGVIGFGFILLHIFSVSSFVFAGNIMAAYATLDPFTNPLVFGGMAQFIFLLLFVTSTDWALVKLKNKNWKTIHRLGYFAYIFAILHFTLTNPPALATPPGYLLTLVTILAVVFQVAGFAKTISKQKKAMPAIIGALIILFGLVLFWLAFNRP